jgi:hypothetical protein
MKSPKVNETAQTDEPQPLAGTLLTVTISDPGLAKRSSEVSYAIHALETVAKELGRGNGGITAGTIVGVGSGGAANTAKGSWTYTPSATLP